jgi:hypothetical protein
MNPRAIVWMEGLGKLEIFNSLFRSQTRNFQLVA